jgi:hypothetical protein
MELVGCNYRLPVVIKQLLDAEAQREFRSANSQLIYILMQHYHESLQELFAQSANPDRQLALI